MSQKVEKVHNYLDPPAPLPKDVLDFFEFGKHRKFDDPPSTNLGKIRNWENLEFWDPLRKKNKLS